MKTPKKKPTKQSIQCDVWVAGLEFWGGSDIFLPANKTYTLNINYPFYKHGKFEIKTGKGMGLGVLLMEIGKAYDKQYQAASEAEDNGYWHGIGDLIIEGITVDHKRKTINLDVGS